MAIKAVLFDCDGVLVDSEPVNFKAWCMALSEIMDIDSLNTVKMNQITGIPLADIYALFEVSLKVTFSKSQRQKLLIRKNEIYRSIAYESLRAFSGARACVEYLQNKGLHCAVVSNSVPNKLDVSLQVTGLSDIFDHVFSTPPGCIKNYGQAIEYFGINPKDVVVVEDSPGGIGAAQSAGVESIIALCTTFGRSELEVLQGVTIYNQLQDIEWPVFLHAA